MKHSSHPARRGTLILLALAMILSLVPAMPASAAGRTIYVSTSGSDSAGGTIDAPLRTIQAAANLAGAGDTIYVRGGTYSERPTFGKAGTSTTPIVVKAYGTETVTISSGFSVTGSYYQISRFAMTSAGGVAISGSYNQVDSVSGSGMASPLTITGSSNLVTNINFYNCGLLLVSGGTHNTVRGGTIHHTRANLALVDKADYTTFDGLDMHDPGQTDTSANAADGLNFNASHFTIRNSRIYNVFKMDSAQHCDAIQWWNVADDFVLENSIIGSRRVGGTIGEMDHGHIQWESPTAGRSSQRVIIRNNVFLGTGASYYINGAASQVILGQADNWQIVGNTFWSADDAIKGDFFSVMRNTRVEGNVFRKTNALSTASGNVYDYNVYVNAATGTNEGSHTFTTTDAKLVNPDLSSTSAYGLNADFHPLSTSPLLSKGVALGSLTTDKAGSVRPTPPTVGAYELPGSGTTTTTPSTPTTTTTTPTALTGTFMLDAGATYTIQPGVYADSAVTGATQMRFDTGSGYGAWMTYATRKAITVPAGDGAKTVTAQYQDASGNTLTLTDSIILDTTAPTGSFSINNGATSTASTAVTANSAVTGATEMRFDTGSGFGAWSSYAAQTALTLPTGDGTKVVQAEYRDAIGNVLSVSDSITLQTVTTPSVPTTEPGPAVAPTGTFALDSGATYTIQTGVWANSAVTGATQMRFDTGSGFGLWIPYTDKYALTLPAGDGPKTVRVEYADSLGDTLALSDDIILDTTAPTGTFSINGGASSTANVKVTATSTITGATQMRFDTGSGFGAWVAYADQYALTLPSGKGTKTVHAEYRDAIGNVAALSDTITLTKGSLKLADGATYTKTQTVTASSSVAGATQVRYTVGGKTGAWVAYGDSKVMLPFPDGLKKVVAQYRDAFGRTMSLYDTIVLDTTPPTGYFRLNRGAQYTYRRGVYAYSNVSGAVKMRIRTGTTYGKWLVYDSTRYVYLSAGTGKKTVYIQYKDRAGNIINRTDSIIRK